MAYSYPKRIIAFDPGGTTGIATHIVSSDFFGSKYELETDELLFNNHHKLLERRLDFFRPDVVVTERFDHRPRQKHADLISVEYIGVMKLWCQKNSVELVQQQQLKGDKGLWTNNKLKTLGLYRSTKGGHSNDAIRQMLWFITVTLEDKYYVDQYKRASNE